MAKALVIKGADFSLNKVSTITFADTVPCTGIALDKQSATVNDTLTLAATLTPSNTTDAVIWTSSDSNVATVSSGIVTAVANGTATITATCGTHTATCEVTVQIELKAVKDVLVAGMVVDTGSTYILKDYAVSDKAVQNRRISIGAANGVYQAVCDKNTGDLTELYPIPIPSGAKTITVSGANLAPLFVFYNKDSISLNTTEIKVATSAKVLYGEVTGAGNDWSIPSWSYDSRTITIPDIDGIDSFTVGFNTKSGSTAFNDFDVDNPYESISIEFGFE